MSDRITNSDLQELVTLLNSLLGENPEPYTKNDDGTTTRNGGTYVIGYANGGTRLERLSPHGSGSQDISDRGTKRETYNFMRAFLKGVYTQR